MKIIKNYTKGMVPIYELEPGDVFETDGRYFVAIVPIRSKFGNYNVISLDSFRSVWLLETTNVRPLKNATLLLDGLENREE